MCLFDTLDGCFMNFAYDWAFSNPVRKVFYNLTMTGLSVAVAFLIGTLELLGLLGQEAGLNSPFWNVVERFNINTAGFVIVGLFVATWAVALVYWRVARVEEKWNDALVCGAGGRGGLGLRRPCGGVPGGRLRSGRREPKD